jgi:MFS family permease
MPTGTAPDKLKEWGGYMTSIFVVGWATVRLIFGAVGDRIGRARALAMTILLYGLCTGLSGLATGHD